MSEIPVPLGWKVIVKPKKGVSISKGGIDVSVTEDAQRHLAYIGELVAVGEAAWTASTAGGIDMASWEARPQVGDFVIYSPYGGMQIRQSGKEWHLLLMNDTDIHGIIMDPDNFYSWIDI